MPENQPSPLGPILGAASGVLGAGINAWAQHRMNKQSQEWGLKMHNLQRQEALADYNMQNEYNSPASQMGRYKAAGLNPHLIYGQSNEGATVRSSPTESWNPKAPEIDLSPVSQGLSQYYDIRQQEAQTSNLQKALEVSDQQIKLIQAQTAAQLANAAATATGEKQTAFNLALAEQLKPLTVEKAGYETDKAWADYKYTINQDVRAAASNASSIAEATERMKSMIQQRAVTEAQKREVEQRINMMKQDQRIKEFDEKMLKEGNRPGDKLWERKLLELLNDLHEKFFTKNLKDIPSSPGVKGYTKPKFNVVTPTNRRLKGIK